MAEKLYAVYTAGKAATTTVHRTLSPLLPERLYDIRRASAEGLEEFRQFAPERFQQTDDAAFAAVRGENPDAGLCLVSLTREPVAAAVSSWFFHFSRRHSGQNASEWTVAEHTEAIVDGQYSSRRDYFTGWFDFECQPFTGIDVYGTGWDHDQGYATYTGGNNHLLVIKSESLNRVYQQAFLEFLGIKVTKLENHHVAEESDYAEAYAQFKREARLPAEFVDEQHSTQYAQHFYTDVELEASRALFVKE